MKRTKIGQGYSQNGCRKGFKKSPSIWLIDGKAYAKDSKAASLDFDPLEGHLAGYVRVNVIIGDSGNMFYRVAYPTYSHNTYPPGTFEEIK